jgi:hypothetical protein
MPVPWYAFPQVSSSAGTLPVRTDRRARKTDRNDESRGVNRIQNRGGQHQVIVGLESLMLETPKQNSRENNSEGCCGQEVGGAHDSGRGIGHVTAQLRKESIKS